MIISKKHPHHSLMFTGNFLLSLCFCLLLVSCEKESDSHVSTARLKQPLHRVEVVAVESKPVNLSQTVSGTLEAVTKIRLYNEESGRITKLSHHEGDTVTKDTLLVQLDNEILKTDVAKAKATKEQEKVDLNRLKKLLPKKISTEEEVAKAKTELDLAIAEEKRQLIRLKRSSIKAPIDGLITKRLYEPGDILAQHSHIHTIIDPSSLQLKASIAERWIPLVSLEQAVTIRIDAIGDKAHQAKIVRIHPTINASTHKGIVEIILDPVPEKAKVGQFARATIELKAANRLIIPVHTIHFEPEGAYVYRVTKDKDSNTVAEKVFFEQGQQFGNVTEILTGLNSADQIVSRGYLGLRDGKKIEVTTADKNKTLRESSTIDATTPQSDH